MVGFETRTAVDDRLDALKAADDVSLPRLRYWNYEPCAAHTEAKVDCEFRACGGELFSYQRIGVLWLYLRKKGLLADLPGIGKTNEVLGLAALMKERGELTKRMLVICQTPSTLQWLKEAERWTTGLRIEAIYSGLTREKRIKKYIQDYDILIVGAHMMLQDWKMLEKLEFDTVAIDDVDALLSHDNATHQKIINLTNNASRVITMNATAIQTALEQVHAALLPAGGFEIFGSLTQFESRYVRTETVREMTTSGRVITKKEKTGYRNGEELKRKLAPYVLRRKYEDLSDVRMPALMPPEHVWLDLHPAQRAKYDELREGVLRLKKEGQSGEKIKHVKALAAFTYGQQICAGLPALGEEDGEQASVKLDWLVRQVTQTWPDRKIVAFIKNVGLVRAAEQRFSNHGVGVAKVWGQNQNAAQREVEKTRFWEDPDCRVLLGTSSIERSLNFQNANILVNVDTIPNPARMTQLTGRIRRAGSTHSHIWVFSLFCRDTQEERMLPVLEQRQAIADFVWSEQSELYRNLSSMELLSLISP